jgi:hypothetical protein
VIVDKYNGVEKNRYIIPIKVEIPVVLKIIFLLDQIALNI